MSTAPPLEAAPAEPAIPPDEAAVRAPRGGKVRTCVGCGERVEAGAPGAPLVRIVLAPGGLVAVDPGGGGFGRGAHVHASPSCVAGAASKGLPRAARASSLAIEGASGERIPLDPATLGEAIGAAMDRRVEGLLASAHRVRAVALGADAVTAAAHRGEAALIVVARDATAAADLGQVRRAVEEGRAVAWSTKDRLGELFHKGAPLGVVAIARAGIASAVQEAVHAADASRGARQEGSKRRKGAPRNDAPRQAEEGKPREGQPRARGRARFGKTVGSRGQSRSG